MGRASGSADSFGSKLGSGLVAAGKLAGMALLATGAAAGAAGIKMIGMASDAEEVRSKMEVVFGKTLPGLTKEIDKFSGATGASRFAMREQAADMGALLAPMLGSKQGAADMSLQFVKLATDLGSFNNIPVADALEKIRAGLVGEAEPLRSLGVLLTEASTKEWAYTHGIAARGAALTEVEKVEARAGQIIAQTALAQGDATRTADSMSNQLKTLKNSVSDAATELGMALIPAALSVVSAFNDNWPRIREVAETVFRAVGGAITDLVAAFQSAWPQIKAAAESVMNWYQNNLAPTLKSVFGNIAAFVGAMVDDISGEQDKMVDDWQKTLKGMSDEPRKQAPSAASATTAYGKGIVSALNSILAVARGDWSTAWDGLKSVVVNSMIAMDRGIDAFMNTLRDAMKAAGLAIVRGLADGLVGLENAYMQKMEELRAGILGFVGEAAAAGFAIGQAISQGIVNGLDSLAGAVRAKAVSIASSAWEAAKGFLGAKSPSTLFAGLGRDTVAGYILGLSEAAPQIAGKMAEVLQKALDAAKAKVSAAQGSLGEAFGNLGEYVSRQFAAKTEAELDKLASRFDRLIARVQARADAATPAEKELAALDAAEAQRTRDRASLEADAQLVVAQAMEEGVEKERAVAAAKEAIRVAALGHHRAALEAQAEIERAAQEASAAKQIAALEATKARELQNLTERRQQQATKLDEQLADLAERLGKHPEEYDKIQKKIQALLASYGVPMRNAGLNLGKAFAKGLDDSADAVERSVKNLARIVAKYLPHSPAEKGPLSKPIDWKGYFTAGLPINASSIVGVNGTPGAAAGFGAGAAAGAVAGGGGGGMIVNLNGPFYGDDRGIREMTSKIRAEVSRQVRRNS